MPDSQSSLPGVGLSILAALLVWRNYWAMHERFGFTRHARLMLWHEAAHAQCDAVVHGASSSDEIEPVDG